MPEFVKRSVWSPAGTRLALGTTVWPRSSKYSRNRLRISAEDSGLILASWVTGGLGIGLNGTERTIYGPAYGGRPTGRCRVHRDPGLLGSAPVPENKAKGTTVGRT